MSWFPFRKKKKSEPEEVSAPKTTKQRVEENILLCKQNKNKLLDRRDDLRKKINQTINAGYFVPSAWWYREYEYFEAIKELPENKILSDEIITSTNELITSYVEELQLIAVQIEHYDFLLQSYQKSLEEIYHTKDQYKLIFSELEKMKQLEKSKDTFNSMKEEGSELLAGELLQEERYKDLRQEIDTLGKDLELFEEYLEQLKKLR